MATTYKVLGQSNPSATTLTSLYTVPAATSAIVSSVVVCNQAGAGTFRIAVAVGGVDANKNYLCYDSPISANDTVTLTLGVTLAATDILKVYASSATMSFNAFGSELT